MSRITFTILLFLGTFSVVVSWAQETVPYDAGNSGRHFVIAFPDTAANTFPGTSDQIETALWLYLYSATSNTAQVSTPVGSIKTYPLNPNTFTLIDLSSEGSVINTSIGERVHGGFIVQTEQPVIAYCYMTTPFGSDGWTPIPVENWGKEYYAMTLLGEVISDVQRSSFFIDQSPAKAPATVLVIAAYDGTSVSIDPTGALSENAGRSVMLNAGEVYQVQSEVDTSSGTSSLQQPGLAGTKITANKPVGVISGNTRSIVQADAEAISRNSLKNLLYEWLAPVDAYGKEFVYTPTWDSRRQSGDPNESPEGKRPAEFMYIVGSGLGSAQGTYQDVFSNGIVHFTVPSKALYTERIAGEGRAAHVQTSLPTQMFMSPAPISRLVERTTVFGNVTKLEYETMGSYLREVVPVEQWSSFAPFVAPSNPGGLEHFLNVVARRRDQDSIFLNVQGAGEQRFSFNKGIVPGTDFVWGTITIVPGVDYYLRGAEGRTFGASIYGVSTGFEDYTRVPGRYDERIGVGYGFPLAPNRNVVAPPDEVVIDTTSDCAQLNVVVTVTSRPAVGLRSVELAPNSVNTELEILSPSPDAIPGASGVSFVLRPANPDLSASAVVSIIDRTGNQTTLPYQYEAQRLDAMPTTNLDFGSVSVGLESAEDSLVFTNSGVDEILVSTVNLTQADSQFEVLNVFPVLPAVLQPGEKITVHVRYNPALSEGMEYDSLVVGYGCNAKKTLPLVGQTLAPCLDVTSLDFGEMETKAEKTLNVTLKNSGSGTLAFVDNGNGVVSGLGGGFSVADQVLQTLTNTRLRFGESYVMPVTFTAVDSGLHERVLSFGTNFSDCTDSATLRARVLVPDTSTTSVSLDYVESNTLANRLSANIPNPFQESTTIEFNLAANGSVRLELFNASGAFVETILNETLESGRYRLSWNATNFSSGIYYLRMTTDDNWSEMRRLVLMK